MIEVEPNQNGVVLQKNITDPEDSENEKSNAIDFYDTWVKDDKGQWVEEGKAATTETPAAEDGEIVCGGSCSNNLEDVLYKNTQAKTATSK